MAMFFPGGTIYLVYLRCGSVWMTFFLFVP